MMLVFLWVHCWFTTGGRAGVSPAYPKLVNIFFRFAHSYDLDDNYAEVNIGALPGDARELHAGIFCTMYFDLALDATQISAAQSLCRLNGKRSSVILGGQQLCGICFRAAVNYAKLNSEWPKYLTLNFS